MSWVYRHNLDPIAFRVGNQEVAWYWLVYLFGFFWCWQGLLWFRKKQWFDADERVLDSLAAWAWFALIGGGRLGYVLFYNLSFYLEHPGQIFALWNGGMSFHGALLGLILCLLAFKKRLGSWTEMVKIADALALLMPPLLGLGRIANFFNGELVGRPTDGPFAVIFPQVDELSRHPSQLYEAFGEGILVTAMLMVLSRRLRTKTGCLSVGFLGLYGLTRFIIEFTREPDPQIGLHFGWLSQGQLLCAAMMVVSVVGLWILTRKPRSHPPLK